jgi:hypothetical protein
LDIDDDIEIRSYEGGEKEKKKGRAQIYLSPGDNKKAPTDRKQVVKPVYR